MNPCRIIPKRKEGEKKRGTVVHLVPSKAQIMILHYYPGGKSGKKRNEKRRREQKLLSPLYGAS